MNLPNFIQKREEPSVTSERVADEPEEEKPGPSSGSSSTAGSYDSGCSSGGSTECLDELKTAENKSVDDARVCKICYNNELGVVFLPCGHMVACVKCAPGMTSCAVCRKAVTATVRAFFS